MLAREPQRGGYVGLPPGAPCRSCTCTQRSAWAQDMLLGQCVQTAVRIAPHSVKTPPDRALVCFAVTLSSSVPPLLDGLKRRTHPMLDGLNKALPLLQTPKRMHSFVSSGRLCGPIATYCQSSHCLSYISSPNFHGALKRRTKPFLMHRRNSFSYCGL